MLERRSGSGHLREGVVLSDKMSKTRTVEVSFQRRHVRFEKIVWMKKSYYVHDEKNTSKTGDKVLIAPSRPVSKLKRWTLVKVL
ncbi:MAG: 30S ribosomal protein S17 [Elusimicrobiota bacterium]